jgi:hypothetical protein
VKHLFPNPVEHAFVMVEACGSLESALDLSQANAEFATTNRDFRYWSMVEAAIMEMAACLIH